MGGELEKYKPASKDLNTSRPHVVGARFDIETSAARDEVAKRLNDEFAACIKSGELQLWSESVPVEREAYYGEVLRKIMRTVVTNTLKELDGIIDPLSATSLGAQCVSHLLDKLLDFDARITAGELSWYANYLGSFRL